MKWIRAGFRAGIILLFCFTVIPIVSANSWFVGYKSKNYTVNNFLSLDKAHDGRYVVLGFIGNLSGYYDFENLGAIVYKINENGEVEWSKVYKGIFPTSITQTPDGYLITGGVIKYNLYTEEACILKVDKNGNFQWLRTYNFTEGEVAATSIKQTSDGYIVAGLVEIESEVYPAIFKIDQNGNIKWQKAFSQRAFAIFPLGFPIIKETFDDKFIFAWNSGKYTSEYSHLLVLDSSGDIEWEKTYNTTFLTDIQPTSDGYILVGSKKDFSEPSLLGDVLVLKVDLNGNIKWSKTYDYGGFEIATSIKQASDGFVVLATGNGGENELFTPYILKIDSDGNVMWSKAYFKARFFPLSLHEVNDGFIFGLGLVEKLRFPYIYLIKTEKDGEIGGCSLSWPVNVTVKDILVSVNSSTPSYIQLSPSTSSLSPAVETTTLQQIRYCPIPLPKSWNIVLTDPEDDYEDFSPDVKSLSYYYDSNNKSIYFRTQTYEPIEVQNFAEEIYLDTDHNNSTGFPSNQFRAFNNSNIGIDYIIQYRKMYRVNVFREFYGSNEFYLGSILLENDSATIYIPKIEIDSNLVDLIGVGIYYNYSNYSSSNIFEELGYDIFPNTGSGILALNQQNQSPIASYTFSPSSPTVGQTITFDASSSYDPDGQIVSYGWNFGDGNVETTTSPTIQHTYSQSGNYTVTLTVTDNDGLTASTSKQITIQEVSQKQQLKEDILQLILQYLQTQDAQQKQQLKQQILQLIVQYLVST